MSEATQQESCECGAAGSDEDDVSDLLSTRETTAAKQAYNIWQSDEHTSSLRAYVTDVYLKDEDVPMQSAADDGATAAAAAAATTTAAATASPAVQAPQPTSTPSSSDEDGFVVVARRGRRDQVRVVDFVQLMRMHVVLTADLLVAMKVPTTTQAVDAAVQRLVRNKTAWQRRLLYHGVRADVADQWYKPAPPEPFGSGVFLEHSLAVKTVFDNVVGVDRATNQLQLSPDGDRALQFLVGQSTDDTAAFWMRAVRADPTAVRNAWTGHVQCTAAYATALVSAGGNASDAAFLSARAACVDQGAEVGGILESAALRMRGPTTATTTPTTTGALTRRSLDGVLTIKSRRAQANANAQAPTRRAAGTQSRDAEVRTIRSRRCDVQAYSARARSVAVVAAAAGTADADADDYRPVCTRRTRGPGTPQLSFLDQIAVDEHVSGVGAPAAAAGGQKLDLRTRAANAYSPSRLSRYALDEARWQQAVSSEAGLRALVLELDGAVNMLDGDVIVEVNDGGGGGGASTVMDMAALVALSETERMRFVNAVVLLAAAAHAHDYDEALRRALSGQQQPVGVAIFFLGFGTLSGALRAYARRMGGRFRSADEWREVLAPDVRTILQEHKRGLMETIPGRRYARQLPILASAWMGMLLPIVEMDITAETANVMGNVKDALGHLRTEMGLAGATTTRANVQNTSTAAAARAHFYSRRPAAAAVATNTNVEAAAADGGREVRKMRSGFLDLARTMDRHASRETAEQFANDEGRKIAFDTLRAFGVRTRGRFDARQMAREENQRSAVAFGWLMVVLVLSMYKDPRTGADEKGATAQRIFEIARAPYLPSGPIGRIWPDLRL